MTPDTFLLHTFLLHMARVVRRCFLLGTNSVAGENYDHHKVWIEEQLIRLAFTTEPQRGTEKFLRFSKLVPFGSFLWVSVVRVVDRSAAGLRAAWYRRCHLRCAGQGVRQAVLPCGRQTYGLRNRRGLAGIAIIDEGVRKRCQ